MLKHFAARPSLLGYALRTDEPFRQAFAAFLASETRGMLIAGEPGNGKSTLLDDIVMAHRELSDFPLAGVAYDAIHGMLLDTLGTPLPSGETHPAARELVSNVLRDTILHALEQLPVETRVLIEAPLIDRRGEGALSDITHRGCRVQAVVLHNPNVWRRVLADGQRDNELAAHVDAMLAIRRGLARRIGVGELSLDEQEQAIGAHWARWAEDAPGRLVLSWSGPNSDEAAAETNRARAQQPVSGSGLYPSELAERARELCASIVAGIPDLPRFVSDVREFGSQQHAKNRRQED